MAVSGGIDATYEKSKGEVVANKGAQPGEKPKSFSQIVFLKNGVSPSPQSPAASLIKYTYLLIENPVPLT